MIDYTTGFAKVRKVDIRSETFEVAKKYMIRLEKEDFSKERLAHLAKITNLAPEEFKARFEYTVEENHEIII